MQSTNSRRRFLRNVGAAGLAAASAPQILVSHSSAETSPSERLGLGFIGMGKMNRGHLRSFLSRKEVQVLAVCEVDTTRREDAKQTVDKAYGNSDCAAYNEFEKLLERDDIDAVVIATPDHWHAYCSIAAVKAGKDVYCEKPLTHNVHEAVTLIEAVRSSGRVLQTGSQQRSSKEFRVAAELVRNEVIGKLKSVEASFGPPAPPYKLGEEEMEPGLDWDRWCGPGPLKPYNSVLSPRGIHNHFPAWRMTREFGGGMVTDWGAHHVDIAQWALGEDGNGPTQIIAPDGWDTAKAGAKLVYASGVPVTHKEGNGIRFFGNRGEIYVNRGRFQLTLDGKVIHKFTDKNEDKGTSLTREVVLTEREYLADAKVKLYNSTNHKEDWLNCIKTREKPICDVAIGASTVISCHLLNMAYYNGGKIGWAPKTHTFTQGGDPAWLTRDYRGPWAV